ncbi:hypothetical protein AOQ88_01725 [Candidatus Riesia sp. GBBU]|nr:hypothetical protein AOQ88_01725 [Candidatus Riesia sp. GBBU]
MKKEINTSNRLKYCIIITSFLKNEVALKFSEALVNEHHILKSVFFYKNGSQNSNKKFFFKKSKNNLVERWKTLSKKSKCKLEVCVSSALENNIIHSENVDRNNYESSNLEEFFVLSTLISLVESIFSCDRVMKF